MKKYQGQRHQRLVSILLLIFLLLCSGTPTVAQTPAPVQQPLDVPARADLRGL